MNVMKLEVEERNASLALSSGVKQGLSHAAGSSLDAPFLERRHWPHKKFRCPECNSIVYSRRNKLCGVCGELLPSSFLFNDHETFQVEALLRNERERHRRWMSRSQP
jgi:hypothetical protein